MTTKLATRYCQARLFQQHCRDHIRRPTSPFLCTRSAASTSACHSSSPSPPKNEPNISAILSHPTWSITSLLPEKSTDALDHPISRTQLHHLLRLCALPQPSSPSEEASMLNTLCSQIHFVKQIQQVDTTNITPLRSLRDERAEAERENTIGVAKLRGALAQEEFVGPNRRIRRRRADKVEALGGESWKSKDILLKSGKKMMGRYFIVQSSEKNTE